MSSVLDIAKKMNKEFKNENLCLKAELQPHYKRVATGNLGFDYPLYGGFPEGRVIQFSGPESSGKTTGACAFIAAYQRKYPEKNCVFIDIEHSFDKEWEAAATGIDLTKLIYVNPENMFGGQILDLAAEFFLADDIGVVCLDSVAALAPKQIFENDVEKETFANISKELGRFFQKSLGSISASKGILLVINQLRPVIGSRLPAFYEPCGKALAYYTSILLRFGKRTYTHGDQTDSREDVKADGIRLWFEIRKNKTAPTDRGGGFLTIRYGSGVDWMSDLFEVAVKYEFIERPTLQKYRLVNLLTGEIYKDKETNEPLEFVGKEKLKKYFMSHIEFQNTYLAMVTEYICQQRKGCGSLLDERMLAEMKAESDKIDKESGIID